MPDLKKLSEPRSGKENFFDLLGGLGVCSPENFKNKGSEIG